MRAGTCMGGVGFAKEWEKGVVRLARADDGN